MRILILCLISSILLTSTCSKKSSEEQIKTFESILGNKSSSELTLLVNEFENNLLTKKYPAATLKQSYELLFNDIKTNQTHIYNFQTEKGQLIWKNSDLKNHIYKYPDSVWIEGNLIKNDYRTLKADGTIESGISTTAGKSRWKFKTIDSLIDYQMTIPIFNNNGRFWKALKKLEKDNEFIKKYNEQIEIYGHIPYSTIPDVLEHYKVDPTDYIIKRIIIKELMY